MPRRTARGATAIEAILVAAAFILLGVMGVLVFQRMGASAAEGIRANAIVTADHGGFDVTIEVLNGRVSARNTTLLVSFPNGTQLMVRGKCIMNSTLYPGQSDTCRFAVPLKVGERYIYVLYVSDPDSSKVVQVAKGSITVGVS